MAGISRSLLASMGLTEEQQKTIIDAKDDTLREIKTERDQLKVEAEKLPGLQKQLDDLKKDLKENYVPKADADKVSQEFKDYKAEIAKKAADEAKDAAARAYFESKGIKGASLEIAMRGSGKEVGALELADDGKSIKDTKALDELISGTYAGLVEKVQENPFSAPTPPAQSASAAMQPTSRAAALYQQHYSALYGAPQQMQQKGSETA